MDRFKSLKWPGKGTAYFAGRDIEHDEMDITSKTYFSDASVMIRHVEYPNFYSPLHRFHHFYDINTSDLLANELYFGPLLGLNTRASMTVRAGIQ